MVNITAIEKIIRFIDNERNIREMKKWSDRFRLDQSRLKSWYIKTLVRKIRWLLNLISGQDMVEMLKGLNESFYKDNQKSIDFRLNL